ncbi:glycosyltransferase family 2 protein [Thioclava sp.]|uniref:glycosyltransferase family 2 protein n=1 Tax=Thioclava sp. TaxID=1933450 RepID=UPI003AA90620
MSNPSVSVLIAAHDCAQTIGRAIASALSQPETAEVIVVDDASQDETRACVAEWAAHDRRVRLLGLDVNAGPAGARNRAIDLAAGDLLAILDSDDFFAPGRLSRLLGEPDWDMIADNVVFLSESRADTLDFATLSGATQGFETLDTARFIRGNLASRDYARGEMGFLKPLISKIFLEKHKLRYDETLRLGEDYDLYVRILLAGARFRLTRQAGYGAIIREGSLSARHATGDLAALHGAIARHENTAGAPERAAMRAYRGELRTKLEHRVFLDRKASQGLIAALRGTLVDGGQLGRIMAAIARDKLAPLRRDRHSLNNENYRLLLSPDD